ncbi:hypothetical protein ACF0H5_004156 [Mactra antiquata]
MSKGLQELIDKFESKKEFREVKLKTRQSFREDQAALERRLSKYRPKSIHAKDMSNGDTNAHRENGIEVEKGDGIESKLESIVMDIREEKSKVADGDSETDSGLHEEEKVEINDDVEVNGSVTNGDSKSNGVDTQKEHVPNGRSHSVSSSNGTVESEQMPIKTETKLSNENISNGRVHHAEVDGLVNRPRVSVLSRSAVTPEPKHKSLRGIYQKNPKLTPLSTDHLDNVSLTGVRPSSLTHGHKTDTQRVAVPPVPSAEVTSLPSDGNVSEFSVEHMVTFFRHLRVPEETVYRLHKCKVDGKRFSVFSDKELTELKMNNPIIRYFRDRTAQRPKRRVQKFML